MVSPFFNLNSRDTSKEDKDRHKEFENCIGNLLVAEFQTFRLRERVKNMIGMGDRMDSQYLFKFGDDWFRISISAEKQGPEKEIKKKEKEPEEISSTELAEADRHSLTHGFAIRDPNVINAGPTFVEDDPIYAP